MNTASTAQGKTKKYKAKKGLTDEESGSNEEDEPDD